MKITLNSLPTRTWNRLNMNDSTLQVEGEFRPWPIEGQWEGTEARWDPDSAWKRGDRAYGFSPDLTALTEGAPVALVETEAGAAMDRPIQLTWRGQAGERGASRLVLHAAPDSTLTAVLLVEAQGEHSTSALQVEVAAENRSVVRLYVAQLLGHTDLCLHELGGSCGKDARVELVRLELGARQACAGASLDLAGEGSSLSVDVGYHGRTGQRLDMNYVSLHHGKKTDCRMAVSGTLEEGSEKVFRGTIDFQKGCAGAKGVENENVLLLGDQLVNQTIPLILCREEDVEGDHGASIGQLDQRMLFYLGSRGIEAGEARKLIARSRIQSVCSKIPDEAVRSRVWNFENGEDEPDGTEL